MNKVLAVFLVVAFAVFDTRTLAQNSSVGLLPSGLSPQQTGVASGKASLEKYADDYFVTVSIGTTLQFDKIGIGVQVPLRIRVIDNEPKSDTWYRQEDWDEVSDWLRIIRFITYGVPTDPIYARLGEFAGESLGHGTIVNRYYNSIDIDHYHAGISFKLRQKSWGMEFLTNDVTRWNLVALRGMVYPLELTAATSSPVLSRLEVGVTLAADFTAPYTLKYDEQGIPEIDSDNNLLCNSKTAFLWGIDVGLPVIQNSSLTAGPYIDFNGLAANGVGLHAGGLCNILVGDFTAFVRVEYRLVGPGYIPSYFNTLYEVEKFAFRPTDSGTPPKLWYAYNVSDSLKHGYYGELYMTFSSLLGIGGTYEDYQGKNDGAVTLYADLPQLSGIKLTAYYTRRNFDGLTNLFSLDNAYLAAQAQVQLSGPLVLYLLYTLHWKLITDESDPHFGEYETVSSYSVGLGASFTF